MKNIRLYIFLFIAGIILLINIFSTLTEFNKMSRLRQRIPYTFKGDQFRGLDAFVGKAPWLGYYTDKSLDDTRAAMQFAQAQLILAPSILDFNNTNHEFIIFDCSSPMVAMKKIAEIGAQPLKANPYGIILARNPNTTIVVKANPHQLKPIKNRQRP